MIFRFLSAQWLAIAYIGLASFSLSILIARTLGPDLFGIYAVALSLGALIAILIDGGFSKLLQREGARGSASLAQIGPVLPGLAYGHAIITILALSVLAAVLFPKNIITSVITVWCFGAAVLNQYGLAVLRGDGRLVRDASWQIGNRTLSAVCMATAVLFLGANMPWHVLMAQFVGTAAFGVFVAFFLRVRPQFAVPSVVYRAVLPLVWLDIATAVYFRSDMVLLEFLNAPKTELGHYGVAYRLIEALILLASPVGLILFRHFRQGSDMPVRMVKKMLMPPMVYATLVGCILASLLWFGSDAIVSLAYGQVYQGTGTLLAILGCSLIFILPNGILNQAALALGLERWFAVSATITALTNVAGNILFIPIYGAMAAAWMTVLTEAVLGLCVAVGVGLHCWRVLDAKRDG
ncbi:MAG: polysaccharide biosynthesis C-terminal domain-containing protein [Methylococcales bacterium]|nr:polysaccharide biosynthesis C-terminal domain-containing protein [Methylococcales bacterium]